MTKRKLRKLTQDDRETKILALLRKHFKKNPGKMISKTKISKITKIHAYKNDPILEKLESEGKIVIERAENNRTFVKELKDENTTGNAGGGQKRRNL